jgi:hypothetical protein
MRHRGQPRWHDNDLEEGNTRPRFAFDTPACRASAEFAEGWPRRLTVAQPASARCRAGTARRWLRRRGRRARREDYRQSGGAETTSNAHQAGFETCSGGTVEEIAGLYGVPKATPDAVSDVIAEQLGGGSREHASIKRGCVDAFASQP